MTLETTQYSNAFSHRKEFNETIKVNFESLFREQHPIPLDTNKLHSYLFSDAFSGSFRSKNIDKDFHELELTEKNLLKSLQESNTPILDYTSNLKYSLSSIASLISKNNKELGIDTFDFLYSNELDYENNDNLTIIFTVNGIKRDTIQILEDIIKSFKDRVLIIEKAAHFLPEIDREYTIKLLSYSSYNNAIKELITFICEEIKANISSVKKDMATMSIDDVDDFDCISNFDSIGTAKGTPVLNEEAIPYAIDISLKPIFSNNKKVQRGEVKRLEDAREEMRKHLEK